MISQGKYVIQRGELQYKPYSALADASGHLCNPCDGKEESCSFCGTPEVDSKHVCKDKLAEMKYVCSGCGRVALEAANVCTPQPIVK